MISRLRRWANYWIDQPSLDYLIIAGTVGLATVPERSSRDASFAGSGSYQTLAEISGILLTLGTVVITLLFTVTPNERLAAVLRSAGDRLQHLVLRCLGGLVGSTAAFGVLVLTDTLNARIRAALLFGAITLMALRFGRLWWLMRRILQTLMTSHQPQLGPLEWERPAVDEDDYALPGRRPRYRRAGG